MNLKGTLPVLILQVLSAGDKHGYAIAQEIKQRSRDVLDFKEGSFYPALHAHEEQGFIASVDRRQDGGATATTASPRQAPRPSPSKPSKTSATPQSRPAGWTGGGTDRWDP